MFKLSVKGDLKDIERIAEEKAIINAYKHGKARVGAVVGKVIAEAPELRSRIKEVVEIVRKKVEWVNSLSREEIERRFSEIGKEERKKEERKWPPLVNAEKYDKIVTRMAPEPNGYPTIGHAKGLLVPFIYARMYRGEFHLRFDDTNPRVERLEYYEIIKEDFQRLLDAAGKVLGISNTKWDAEKRHSDDIPLMQELAEKLIREGRAYVCTCNRKILRKNRREGVECKCRSRSVEENLELWDKMKNEFREGEAHLRLKTDMKHPNPTMRDPGIFRIIEAPHPVHGDKYRVYPTYDFAISIEDAITGVTHAFRSKEFEPHVEVQKTILRWLGLRQYEMIQFGRLSVEGVQLSKRYIRPLIEAGLISSWEDPRLPTLRGLFNRGITPEALVMLIYEIGPSKVDSTVKIAKIESYNRKVLDPIAPRYMFVADPIKMVIENAPEEIEVKIPVHPDFPERGYRKLKIKSSNGVVTVYISMSDFNKFKVGGNWRLKDFCNVKIKSVMPDMVRAEYLEEKNLKVPIIQWVWDESKIAVKLVKPETTYSLRIIGGYGERDMLKLHRGDIVQLIRVGFARVVNVGKDRIKMVLSHS